MEQNSVPRLKITNAVFTFQSMTFGILLKLYKSDVSKLALFLSSCVLCSLSYAKEVHFSPSVTITENQQSKTLHLTGTADRSVMFFKVYSLAHYTSDLPLLSHKKPDVFNQIIDAKSTKQISIVFRRNLKASQITEKLSNGVEDNCVDDEFKQVQSDLDLFKKVIKNNVKKNDEFNLRWQADDKLLMFYNGEQVGELESPLLARLLWSVWFGADAVVKRSDLVENLTAETAENRRYLKAESD